MLAICIWEWSLIRPCNDKYSRVSVAVHQERGVLHANHFNLRPPKASKELPKGTPHFTVYIGVVYYGGEK